MPTRSTALRMPTAYRKAGKVHPLLKFLENKADGSLFARLTLPIGTEIADEDGARTDLTWFEFTVPAEWVFIPFDATRAELADKPRNVIVLMPETDRDGQPRPVRLKREMGDYDDDGQFVSCPVEKCVDVHALEAALDSQRESYVAECRRRRERDAERPSDEIEAATRAAALGNRKTGKR